MAGRNCFVEDSFLKKKDPPSAVKLVRPKIEVMLQDALIEEFKKGMQETKVLGVLPTCLGKH